MGVEDKQAIPVEVQAMTDFIQGLIDYLLRVGQAALLNHPFLEGAQRTFLAAAVVILREDVHAPQLIQLLARLDRVFPRKESRFVKGPLPRVGAGWAPRYLEMLGHSNQRLGGQQLTLDLTITPEESCFFICRYAPHRRDLAAQTGQGGIILIGRQDAASRRVGKVELGVLFPVQCHIFFQVAAIAIDKIRAVCQVA